MLKKDNVLIIAEAGDNHNGNYELALKLVDKAVEAKADYVKFQTFKTENIISKYAEKADYQKVNTKEDESQFEMVKKLELSYEQFRSIDQYCKSKDIIFISTPFDLDSIDFLENINIPLWKIPSGEITNLPYLEKIGKTGKAVILSTGMCTMEEIEQAMYILRKNGTGEITLLHCNTEYPTPFEDVNLRAMKTMREAFGVSVGYSDHTIGIETSIAAVAYGATIIEKHFTLDKRMEGPDHKASLEPDELKKLVLSIRNVERAMGSAEKKPSPSEEKNIHIARKSIVAKHDVMKGETFTEENISIKRPGNGISPMRWYEIIGKKAIKDFKEDELITE